MHARLRSSVTHRATDANGLVLDEGGSGPRDVIAFMLSRVRMEVEDSPPEERTNDGLLERGDNTGVDGGVHESILDGIKALGEDVVVSREAHVARYCTRRLIRLSGW